VPRDAIIVGAGPSGGIAARQLAAAGFDTLILEKKKVVGEPVQCAEGVSHFGLESNGLKPEDRWVAQRVTGARCFMPNGTSIAITDLPGYAIDRAAFDQWLVDGAVDHGAELRTSTKVERTEPHGGGWRVHADGKVFESRILIAADGPTSRIANGLGLLRRQEAIRAYEYRFRAGDVPNEDPDRFLLFVARRYDGGYAWIFPRGDAVNVGAGGHIDAHAATLAFCRERGIDPSRRLKVIAGTIPYRYEFTTYALPGLAVVGDAAGVANPMNGAGIHPGLFSGRIAGEFAVQGLEREDAAAMLGYDRVIRASPFLDPLLFWTIERIRRWSDGLLNTLGSALDGRTWRAVDLRLAASFLARRPWMVLRAREFTRMIRALELCEYYGW